MPTDPDAVATYRLAIIQECEPDPVHDESFTGTDADMNRRLGEIWNAHPVAVFRGEEYMAVAFEGDSRKPCARIGGWPGRWKKSNISWPEGKAPEEASGMEP
ncbi:hypothetical protein LAZ40_01475 [Cereibacter sphaeroides]|uniref:hypothetical protein n=1 Tax=Cereibacter sphaeroides TaxID=1063 RepID=UPI001F27238C|nr:hypothetical protein [Cereibacter sphaeroides]MCE6957730.1 hypothetical protein [Cereibacter sphaeroides]MCE6971516.1 hypothetical protein [Cereibacter sphaeroides]